MSSSSHQLIFIIFWNKPFSKRLHIMAAISGGSGPHQQHPGGLGSSKKAARKESPDPPPRELILASPDLRLNSKSRLSWSSFTAYFDCLGPKRMFVSTKRTRSVEFEYFLHFLSIVCHFRLISLRRMAKMLPKLKKTLIGN